MKSAYWTQIRIDAAGNCKIEEVRQARLFFQESFPEFATQQELEDIEIQRRLVTWIREEQSALNSEQINLSKCCLQCFISHQIEQACQRLVSQFGVEHGFTKRDLLPLVLDNDRRNHQSNQPNSSYQSLQNKILQSFDPSQSSLATWTNKCVRHHRDLNVFLLEHGIYLVSDWAILNDTSSKQLQRIYQFYHLTPIETQQAVQLLESYHAVYRLQRLQQRQTQSRGQGQCLPPTTEQLQQIARRLISSNMPSYTPEELMALLQDLATRLREYRIAVRSKTLPTESLVEPNSETIKAPDDNQDASDEQTEFLKFYVQQRTNCLDTALKQIIQEKVTYIRRKKPQKAQQFLIALELFHCKGKSMTEIAPLVDLAAQYHVTRLLQLKDLRADVRRKLLGLLRDRVVDQAQAYANPERLQTIDEAIDEDITRVIQESQTEASTPNTNKQITKSLFAKRLCRLLDVMRTQND